MHLLTGLAEPSTPGVAHIYDLRTMEVEREPVVPEPELPGLRPTCGAEPAREAGTGAGRPTSPLLEWSRPPA